MGGTPRNAGIRLNIHGDNLKSQMMCSGGCEKAGPTHSEGTYASVVKSCKFNGVDFVRGGSYTAPSDTEEGYGTCKITVPPQGGENP
jgi:hypothetical protein